MSTTLALCVIFACGGRTILRIWSSRTAFPTQELLLLMCVWVMLSTFMSNTAIVLEAKGKTQLLGWRGLAAALNIGLSIYQVKRIGTPGVILGTIVSYLLVLFIPQTLSCYQLLRERQ